MRQAQGPKMLHSTMLDPLPAGPQVQPVQTLSNYVNQLYIYFDPESCWKMFLLMKHIYIYICFKSRSCLTCLVKPLKIQNVLTNSGANAAAATAAAPASAAAQPVSGWGTPSP